MLATDDVSAVVADDVDHLLRKVLVSACGFYIAIFPCIDDGHELATVVIGGATDAPEVIDDRIARASYELSFAQKFDKIVINDDLEQAKRDILALIEAFLNAEKDKS